MFDARFNKLGLTFSPSSQNQKLELKKTYKIKVDPKNF